MTPDRPSPSLNSLEPGDHICCIYRTEEEHRAVITAFVRRGLEQSHKIIYIADTNSAEHILGYLRKDGLDVDLFLSAGQLNIIESRDTYLLDGVFDPDGMIAMLRAEEEKCLAEGYKALRVTNEMTWALGEPPGTKRLMEYEAKLNDFFANSRCLAICQYDRRRFEAALLLDILPLHPLVVIGDAIGENFCYLPPEELSGPDPDAAKLNRLLANLELIGRTIEALRESEERYRALFDRSLDLVYLHDFQGNFIDANPEALNLLGYKKEEISSLNFVSLLTQDQIRPAVQALEEITRIGHQQQPSEFRLKKKNGEELHVETKASLIYRHGAPHAILGVGRDLTKRKQAEDELRRERDLVSQIMQTSPAAIVMVNREGRIIYANPQAELVLGLSKEKITQRSYNDPEWRITDLDGNPFPDDELPFRQAMAAGRPVHNVRHAIEWPNGRRTLLNINAAPLYDALGEFSGTVTLVEDITERLAAEKTLRASEKKFKSLINGNLDGIIVLDKKGLVLYVNPAAEELFGRPAEQFLGKAFGFSTVDGERTDIQIIKKNREIALAEMRVIKTKWEDRTAYLASLRDITARKRAEEALRDSEARYKAIFEGAAEGILVADVETRQFRYANPAICRMLGYTEEELLRLSVADIHPKESLARVAAEFEAQARGEKRLAPALPCLRRDGGVFYADNVTAPVEMGGRTYNVGFFSDVTDRRRAEERLQEQFRLLQALMENTPSAIFIKDAQGRYLSCNQPFAEFLGASRDELVGKTIYDFRPKELADQVTARDEALLRNPGKQIYEMESPHADGSLRNILFQKATFTNAEG
ncbi:MAG: PAS domain S-box protein, partial [Pseudomonadota bacterium]